MWKIRANNKIGRYETGILPIMHSEVEEIFEYKT